ncbi:hypothetical protein BDN71DRAFT_1396439, partial [Pleurotus eryngii]
AASACADPSKAVFLQRAYRTYDHFYTTNTAEMTNAVTKLHFRKEGHQGRVFTYSVKDTVPLFRLYSHGADDHFYTTSAPERDNAAGRLGYKNEGVAGHLYAKQICGSVPFYRLYSPHAKDHFYTTSLHEANASGYQKEGIVGYVLPN